MALFRRFKALDHAFKHVFNAAEQIGDIEAFFGYEFETHHGYGQEAGDGRH
jgi:hypothetical protein